MFNITDDMKHLHEPYLSDLNVQACVDESYPEPIILDCSLPHGYLPT